MRVAVIVFAVVGVACRGADFADDATPSCGDGVVQDDEACDDGADNSGTDPYACQPDCTRCRCDARSTCAYEGDTFVCGPCPDGWLFEQSLDSYANYCFAQLLALEVVGGTLDATFDPTVLAYTVTVDEAVEQIAFIPTVTDGGVVDVNGVATSSGEMTPMFDLRFGTNEFGFYVRDGITTTVLVQKAIEVTYLKASNAEADDNFGTALAFDGDTLAVAAVTEAGGGSGVTGDPLDNSVPGRGAVYVFRSSGGSWAQEAYLKPTSPGPTGFGRALGLSGDRLAVSGDGHVDVFLRTGAVWSVDGSFSGCRHADLDGDTLVAHCDGELRVYRRGASTWDLEATLQLPGSDLAASEPVALDGDRIVAAATYEVETSRWPEVMFQVVIFERTGTSWNIDDVIEPLYASKFSLDGDRLAMHVGEWNDGVARVYVRTGAGWIEELTPAVPTPSGDVALALPYLAVADEPFIPGVWVRVLRSSGWRYIGFLLGSDVLHPDFFGNDLAIGGNLLAVGASNESSSATGIDGDQFDDSAPRAGAVYVITLPP